MPNPPIICLDFDGVIHWYRNGWQGGVIYDPVTPGFFKWAAEAQKHFKLVIYSSRSKDPFQIDDMKKWLCEQAVEHYANMDMEAPVTEHVKEVMSWFEFAHEKPPAFLTIDDRAITFHGNWENLDPEKLREFKPWNN